MALVQKTNPVGIDFEINQIQKRMYDYFASIGWADHESYPRAYVNPKDEGTIPEVYVGNKEYKECLFDDKFNVTSFFIADDTRSFDADGGQISQDISIIFQANIKTLYPSILHRADEEMHKHIYNSIVGAGIQDRLSSIITGVENVYSDLSIPASFIEKVKLDDMSNFHVVKVDLTLPFSFCNQ